MITVCVSVCGNLIALKSYLIVKILEHDYDITIIIDQLSIKTFIVYPWLLA